MLCKCSGKYIDIYFILKITFQVILAFESIVLCKCSGKYIDIYFRLKITFVSEIGYLTEIRSGSHLVLVVFFQTIPFVLYVVRYMCLDYKRPTQTPRVDLN